MKHDPDLVDAVAEGETLMESMISGIIHSNEIRNDPGGIAVPRGRDTRDWRSLVLNDSIPHTTEDTTESIIPYGYCHCGCGRKTTIIPHDDRASNRIKGTPSQFIRGHHRRLSPQPIILMNDYAMIPLMSAHHPNQYAVVDLDDMVLVSNVRWFFHSNSKSRTAYAFGRINGQPNKIAMHRFLLGVSSDGPEIDHIDGNGLNNRRSNLRLCSRNENQQNTRTRRVGRSGYRGVHRVPKSEKWYAKISKQGVVHRIGGFDTPEQAACAYDDAALRLYGPHALTNFRAKVKEIADAN
jgi:hypothetical protein